MTKKTGGAKTTRSETVTVRLDPRSRYMAELAARSQRRTLSSFIEWAVAEGFKSVVLDPRDGGPPETLKQAEEFLWDVHPGRRLALLQRGYPHLLTFEEQRLWKLCCDLIRIVRPALNVEPKRAAEVVEDAFIAKHFEELEEIARADGDVIELAKKYGYLTISNG